MTREQIVLDERILAIDVRPHWFGFAVFNNLGQLVDFGLLKVASVRGERIRLIRLIRAFWPRLIVVRRTPPPARQPRPTIRAFRRLLLRLSDRFAIKIVRVSDGQMLRYFKLQGVNNKYEAASLLARQSPELSWRLPPPRKRWQHEHKNMPIFDAVAVGRAHFTTRGGRERQNVSAGSSTA
jgi:hypothetical protein